jgi:chemotaxis protein CheZ
VATALELKAEWANLVAALSESFANGDRDSFLKTLGRLGETRDGLLYGDLRDLSRSLRFALDQIRVDSRLATLAGKEVPDARLRLNHVLTLTEQGAHRTLDLVEQSCPLAEKTAKEAAALLVPLRNIRDGITEAAALQVLLTHVETFLASAQRDSDTVRTNLTEVLMAQSYQDLSGQIIRGVITLVTEVERTLTRFSALVGDGPEDMTVTPSEPPSSSSGFGPAVPGVTSNSIGEQNDVDALLANLGM